jgi:site-specific DNA recombinase
MMNEAQQRTVDQTFGRFGKTEIKKVDSKMVIKYTRVSGKKQFDNNDSIENQNNTIDEFAKKLNLEIVANFGDTHESAKTDDRKEFQRMIEFCKRSRGKISTILVYKMTRFSRTGGKAISIADELRNKYGIHIIAVTEPMDTTNPNGVLFQEMQLIFAKWDNVQRQQVTSAGMKSKFRKGEWLSRVPQGYDIVKGNGERKIVLNEVGKKIKKAWDWKLKGMKNEVIAERLANMGVKMYKQQIYKIFKNPFYCGLIAHGMLDGKVVEGKQEKMISQEVFYKIHALRMASTKYGVPHKKENDQLPLKVFVKCGDCNEPLTGYIVKKKNLYYYKCRTKGCKCNKNATDMHTIFMNELAKLKVDEDFLNAISVQLEYAYYANNKENIEKEIRYNKRLTELKIEMDRLDEKYYIKEEINKEKYDNFIVKFMNEEKEICKNLEDCSISISNLQEKIKEAGELGSKLPLLWEDSDLSEKETLQKLVFPEGLCFNKKLQAFRTPKTNEVFSVIAHLSGDLEVKTKGLNVTKNIKSLFAERAGFEPAIPLQVYMLSRHARSATLTPLRFFRNANVIKIY